MAYPPPVAIDNVHVVRGPSVVPVRSYGPPECGPGTARLDHDGRKDGPVGGGGGGEMLIFSKKQKLPSRDSKPNKAPSDIIYDI